MRRVRRFLGLGWAAQWLLLQAAVLVAGVRLGLWVLPYRVVRSCSGASRVPKTRQLSGERIVWAVSGVSRLIPGASCLTQALAAEILLRSNGYPASVRIGVAKKDRDTLEAHAWVESGGAVLIGNYQVERYTSLG